MHVYQETKFGAALLVVLLMTTAACGDDEPAAPTEPTPTTITDTFTGAVNRNGAVTHTFAATRSGAITATLTVVGPDSALVIGLSLGTWNGVVCQIVLANDRATQGSSVPGNAGSAGNFCVRIYDVGNIADIADYQVTVTHF